jgi:hypothetical protein
MRVGNARHRGTLMNDTIKMIQERFDFVVRTFLLPEVARVQQGTRKRDKNRILLFGRIFFHSVGSCKGRKGRE